MPYWLRLARPEWVVGSAVAASALGLLLVRVGGADDVPGTIITTRFVAAVLSVGVAAAFLDSAATVLDATPYRRYRRLLTPPALALAALTLFGAALALTQMARVQGVPWPAVLFQATGLVALAAATGSACRGRVDPVLVAPVAVVGLIILDSRAPWGPILTAPPGADWTRTQLAWAALAGLCIVAAAIGLRDPARPTYSSRVTAVLTPHTAMPSGEADS